MHALKNQRPDRPNLGDIHDTHGKKGQIMYSVPITTAKPNDILNIQDILFYYYYYLKDITISSALLCAFSWPFANRHVKGKAGRAWY